MRAGLSETHAEEFRRPVRLYGVYSLLLRSSAWDLSSGVTHTLQVTGPAARFPQKSTLVLCSDRGVERG